ncbi:MAG: rRNA maturation RNase YbeY [Alphaproteobacteria bacterium]|jgi:probable rRNA maturation factor|nr:rRNA maturation RNase YbeY [Alphaproteobacteria bacterium]
MTARHRKSAVTIDVIERAPSWRRALPAAPAICRAAAAAALTRGAGRLKGAEVSIVLADDALSARLNRTYRGIPRPTNVLSFATAEPPRGAAALRLLGDVVLAYGTIAREARAQGKSLADHLAHLVVHGVLHLLGFDHERDREARRMEALEVAVLAGLGIADPYQAREPVHG